MKTLFDKTTIKNIELKNRFVRSATHEGMASDEGYCTENLLKVYTDLAKGGVGLIITGFSYTIENENTGFRMLAAYDDKFVASLKTIADGVHEFGAKILLQLASNGSQSKMKIKDKQVWGASAVEHKYTKITPQEMTKEDIKTFINHYAQAALRAKKAGFDGVQVHSAHGYLLNQFLTPYYNRRTDEYGGNIENRSRLLCELYTQIRQTVGEDFVVGVKINCSDFMDTEGLQPDEAEFVCQKLDQLGIDLIEISGNVGYNQTSPIIFETDIRKDRARQSYFAKYAAKIAEKVSAPVSVVGGNRDFGLMTEILNSSKISYFSLSRTLLSEPDLINKWSQDNAYTPKCLSCNKCWSLKGNSCILNRNIKVD